FFLPVSLLLVWPRRLEPSWQPFSWPVSFWPLSSWRLSFSAAPPLRLRTLRAWAEAQLVATARRFLAVPLLLPLLPLPQSLPLATRHMPRYRRTHPLRYRLGRSSHQKSSFLLSFGPLLPGSAGSARAGCTLRSKKTDAA